MRRDAINDNWLVEAPDVVLPGVKLLAVELPGTGVIAGFKHTSELQQQPVKPVWSIVPQLFVRSEIQVLHSTNLLYSYSSYRKQP